MNRNDLSDLEWSVIESLLPNKGRGEPRGWPRRPERYHAGASGLPRRDLSERCGLYVARARVDCEVDCSTGAWRHSPADTVISEPRWSRGNPQLTMGNVPAVST